MVGKVPRRVVIIGGAAVVVIVGYAYVYRSRIGKPATPVVDPALGSIGGDGSYTNPAPHTTVPGTIDTTGGEGILTNDQWGTAVISDLSGLWDATFVAVAIGRYLAGEPLTTDEANVVRTAWARRGHPPQGNIGIVLVQSNSTPGTPNPPSRDPQPGPPRPDQGPAPAPPPAPAPTPGTPRRYVITRRFTTVNAPWQSTLSGIANHSGRSVSQLANWNGITDPNRIGEGIRIWCDPPGVYLGTTQIG